MVTRRRKKKSAATDPELEVGSSTIEASSTPHAPDPSPSEDETEKTAQPHRPGRRGAPVEYPRPGVAWGNIIKDTFRIPDPPALAKRLRAELTLGDENRTSYAAVLEALDKSATNLDDAGRLFRASKVEEDRFRLESEVKLEVLRTDASKRLRAEYQAKLRKSPTIQDVEDMILDNWPTEYREILGRRSELHGAVRSLEILVKAWGSRCADLRIMAERTSRTGTGR